MCTMLVELSVKTMSNQQSTIIYLTDEDAVKFSLFMKHYEKISLLIESGAFEQKNGTIALNFDNNGELKTIQRADFLYSARHKNP